MKSDNFLEICKKCGALCCKVGGPNFTEKEMKRVLDKGFENHFFKVREGIYELKTRKGFCPYLNSDNSCKIQEVKPILCICHPVFPSFSGKKKYTLINCPLAKIMDKKQIKVCKLEADKVSDELIEAALDWDTINKEDRKIVLERFEKLGKEIDID